MRSLETVRVTRYVTPLREGGSLPAIVEADDDGLYVLKFRGAGQGPLALVAELITGELARALGLPVPRLVLMELDGDMARTEPDPEISDLIRASAGLNLGLDFLPGSVMFDPTVTKPDADIASQIVWLDAFVSNVDRTPRNTNLLLWHKRLWLIDHGASLYFHHSPTWNVDVAARARDPFAMVKEHVLLRFATSPALRQADERFAPLVTAELVDEIVGMIPDAWLNDLTRREDYVRYLQARVQAPRAFVEEALRVR